MPKEGEMSVMVSFGDSVARRLASGERLVILVQPAEGEDGQLTDIGRRRARQVAEYLRSLMPEGQTPQMYYDPGDPVADQTAWVMCEELDCHLMGTHSSLDSRFESHIVTEWVQDPYRHPLMVYIGVTRQAKVLANDPHDNFGPGCCLFYFVDKGHQIVSQTHAHVLLEEEQPRRRSRKK